MTLKIQALFMDRNRYVAPLTRLMESQLSSTSYLHLQPQYSYKQTINKPAQIHFLSKRPYTITENMDRAIGCGWGLWYLTPLSTIFQ
jgi:hypothetical protein